MINNELDDRQDEDDLTDEELDNLLRLAPKVDLSGYRRPSDASIQNFFLGNATPDENTEIRRALALSRDFRQEMSEIARDYDVAMSKDASERFSSTATPGTTSLPADLSTRKTPPTRVVQNSRPDLTYEDVKPLLPPHFVLGEIIGRGGFATVYRIHNKRLGVDWALKSIHLSKLTEGTQVAKVLKEAQFPAKIHHPNVVTVHDVDEVNGLVYMECVDGMSLKELILQGVTSWKEFDRLAHGILSGLAEAHRHGIIHGDLSPGNILLTHNGVPKLVDFGFSRHVDRTTSTVGMTAGYATPEHIEGRKLSPQSDVFSAGIILYQLATGQDPFQWDRKSYQNYCLAVIEGEYSPPEFRFWKPPGSLETVICRALSKERASRYPSAIEMLQAYENAARAASRPEPAPSPKPLRHYRRGLKYYSGTTKQEMDWAEEEFNKALIEDPRMAEAYVGLADVSIFRYMSYFDRSPVSLAKAEHYCQKALEISPSSPEAYRSLGRVFFQRRDYVSAEEHLQEAIRLNPDYLAAHISLAWNFIEAHDLERAEQTALTARALAEDELEVLMTFARISYDKKEFERSIAFAQEGVDVHRRAGRLYYDLAMAQRAVGNFGEARRNFGLSIEYQGDPNSRVDLGLTALLEGNLDEARAQFASAMDDTFGFVASYYLGFTEYLLEDSHAAELAFRKSLEASEAIAKKDPGDPLSRAIGAIASAALGDAHRSMALALMARELDPKDGFIGFYCACASSWLDKAAAFNLLKEALALPHSPSKLEVSFDPHFRKDFPDGHSQKQS